MSRSEVEMCWIWIHLRNGPKCDHLEIYCEHDGAELVFGYPDITVSVGEEYF